MKTKEPPSFSPRQKDIIKLLILGYSHKQIALELHIADSTLARHFEIIRHKLNTQVDVSIVLSVLDTYFDKQGNYIGG